MKRRPARVVVGPAGIAGVTLAGTWLGHTLEYLRVWGSHGAASSMAASVHAYMEPAGALLLSGGLLGVFSTARLARQMEGRLESLRRASLGRSGGPQPTSSRGDAPSWSLRLPTLLVTIWVGQCALYLLQENLEASAAGRPLPGLAALGGIHALAAVVHLSVALTLVAALWIVRRQVTRLAEAVERAVERLRPSTTAVDTRPYVAGRTWTPLDRWGSQRWSRPPPLLLIA